MTRMSKQGKRRHLNPKKRKHLLVKKTGAKKDNLPKGFKEHANAIETKGTLTFIPKIKSI